MVEGPDPETHPNIEGSGSSYPYHPETIKESDWVPVLDLHPENLEKSDQDQHPENLEKSD